MKRLIIFVTLVIFGAMTSAANRVKEVNIIGTVYSTETGISLITESGRAYFAPTDSPVEARILASCPLNSRCRINCEVENKGGILTIVKIVRASSNDSSATEKKSTQTFDCRKASGNAEGMICNSYELLDMDAKLKKAYQAALKNKTKGVANAQAKWKQQVDKCTNLPCIKRLYQVRLSELKNL